MLILAINPQSGRGQARKKALIAKKHFDGLGIPVTLVEGNSLDDFREKLIAGLDDETISGIEPEGPHRFHGIGVVVPLGGRGEPLGRKFHCLVQGLEGGGNHPKERQKEKKP